MSKRKKMQAEFGTSDEDDFQSDHFQSGTDRKRYVNNDNNEDSSEQLKFSKLSPSSSSQISRKVVCFLKSSSKLTSNTRDIQRSFGSTSSDESDSESSSSSDDESGDSSSSEEVSKSDSSSKLSENENSHNRITTKKKRLCITETKTRFSASDATQSFLTDNFGHESKKSEPEDLSALLKKEFRSTKGVSRKPRSVSNLLRNIQKQDTHEFGKLKISQGTKVDKNFAAFEKHTKGIGLKLMIRMGYNPGEALGAEKDGLVNPIDVKLRPKQMGLGHGGFDEKTPSVKNELYSKEARDNLNSPHQIETNIAGQWKKSFGAKKESNRKTIHYKTVEELMQEQEQLDSQLPVLSKPSSQQKTKIIDMTGRQAKEIDDLRLLKSNIPLYDSFKHLPELRYNLQLLQNINESEIKNQIRLLIVEKTKIDSISKERNTFCDFMAVLTAKNESVRKIENMIRQIQQLSYSKLEYHLDNILHDMCCILANLQNNDYSLFLEYKLDAVIVSFLLPYIKESLSEWDPLLEPKKNVEFFKGLKALVFPEAFAGGSLGVGMEEYLINGTLLKRKIEANDHNTCKKMLPYEYLLYTVWLPRVRAVLCNEWSPINSSAPIIELLEAWFPSNSVYLWSSSLQNGSHCNQRIPDSCLLPYWLYNNIIEQLLLPKLKYEIEESPTSLSNNLFNKNRSIQNSEKVYLHQWLFLWLPILSSTKKFSSLLPLIRQHLTQVLSAASWHTSQIEIINYVTPWTEIFSNQELDSILSKTVLPKFIILLRHEFQINPREQDIKCLQWIFEWRKIIRGSLMGHLFRTEFFPKWIEVLKKWLTSDSADFAEISQWYISWKQIFPSDLATLDDIVQGFKQGLDLMNQAVQGKLDQSLDLATPIAPPLQSTISSPAYPRQSRPNRVIFKDIVEQAAMERDLLFVPLNQVYSKGIHRHIVYRLGGQNLQNSKGGILVYLDDGVLFAYDAREDQWKPNSVERIIELASKNQKQGVNQ